MRKTTLNRIAAALSALGIAVGANLIAAATLPGAQFDLTAGRLYTLSPGTRQVLAGLKEPVTLRLFYSHDLGAALPAYGAYYQHVQEMLSEYATLSHGKVRVQTLDPAPFSDTEDQALAQGLQGVPLDAGGTKVYFGLAGSNLLDDERTIPFFQPERERFLEYDLTRLVYELSNPTRPVVGIMSTLPLDGDPRAMMMTRGQAGKPFAVSTLLRQANKVETVQTDAKEIPADVRVLLLVAPRGLAPDTLYAIDQFVMRGGRLIALVDPWSETAASRPNPTGAPTRDASADLGALFKAWGITFDPSHVVGELQGAWQVSAGPDDASGAVRYPAWFTITDGINRDDPATAELHRVSVASAGAIAKAPGAPITFTPLLSTDGGSGLIDTGAVKDPDPARVLADFHPDGRRRVIAARIQGTLDTAFPKPPKGAAPGPHLMRTERPANIVIVADSDLIADRYWLRTSDFFGHSEAEPFADNGAFVANLVDTLAGSDALIGLRARGTTARPFTVVARMQEQAEAQYRRTEESLRAHLAAVQKQLQDLRRGDEKPGGAVLTPAQAAAIQQAQADILDTRRKLRAVQYDLGRDIAQLKTGLILLDIVAIPATLALGALGLAILRGLRGRRYAA